MVSPETAARIVPCSGLTGPDGRDACAERDARVVIDTRTVCGAAGRAGARAAAAPAVGAAMLRAVAAALLLATGLAGCALPSRGDGEAPVASASSAAAATPVRGGEPIRVRVIAFNDFHGQIEPGGLTLRLPDPAAPGKTWAVGAGGAAHLATLVRRLRAQAPHSVLVSGGDLVGASPIASALFRDEPTIEAMNRIGLDLGVLGNHEFDRGVDELRRLLAGGCHPGADSGVAASCAGPSGRYAGAEFPLFAANVFQSDGRSLLAPAVVREFDGRRVAFVGAVLRGTPTVVLPSGIAGLRFEDEADAINRQVGLLKAQGIEAFVAVIHEGGTTSGDWNDPTCPGARGEIFAIADRLRPEVDVVLSGHSHQGYSCVRDAPGNPGLRILQAVANGRAVSVVDLALDRATGDVDRARTQARNLPVANGLAGDRAADAVYEPLPADPAVGALVAHYAARAEPLAGRVIGRLDGDADRAPSPGGDGALGRLVADAQLAATRAPAQGGARIALMNPGGLRADLRCAGGAPPCAVSFGQVFGAQPFGNSLVVMTLTGTQLVALLEQQFTGPNATRPRILQPSSGFGWGWRPSAPPGARIVDVRLDGQPIVPTGAYRVTVNSFLAEGGDGFTVLRDGTDRLGGMQDLDALAAYMAGEAVVAVPREARVRRGD
jgi:5'-nucleotidase